MRSLWIAASLLTGIVGCSKAPVPVATQAAAEVDAPAALKRNPSERAICPQQWQCSSTFKWYSTQAKCVAACPGGTCDIDYHCGTGCFCP